MGALLRAQAEIRSRFAAESRVRPVSRGAARRRSGRGLMPLGFGTHEWAQALETAINASSEYRNAAASWGVGFNGNLLLAFERGGALEQGLYLLLKLERGRCLAAEFVPGPSRPEAGFTLRAPYPIWREILNGKTLAASAILTGSMRVEGNMIALLKHAGAHRSLIHCVSSLDTRFPGP
ncbi:MAG: hypothetical protein E6K74_05985 [Candidatus Eisenbacteria bacterium]|uniref:SCP2 domain-containing protein n=1 Tax=Eiseniibacteriota bacterium TaxID=2212470 RepID=A0A538SSZ2_UNCEI|nr:MAG: hypothetical protein E6K74_05985 [Candidatus Eisenbacteria bacterium]